MGMFLAGSERERGGTRGSRATDYKNKVFSKGDWILLAVDRPQCLMQLSCDCPMNPG
jgi:hypothetical protein